MGWNELTWKFKVFFSRINYAAIFLVVGLLMLGVIIFAAPLVMGPRGDLLVLVVEWLIYLGLSGLFSILILGFFLASKNVFKWMIFVGVLFFGTATLYAAWQEIRSLADLVLPFSERRITVVKTYYEQPQTGRGALPETGGWHLMTSDGEDYTMRASGGGKEIHAGIYEVRLSRFKKIVMTAESAQ